MQPIRYCGTGLRQRQCHQDIVRRNRQRGRQRPPRVGFDFSGRFLARERYRDPGDVRRPVKVGRLVLEARRAARVCDQVAEQDIRGVFGWRIDWRS